MFCSVLIIDKRKELPFKYKKSLETSIISVHVASNIPDGLDYLEKYEPDLIILSDSLPGNVSDLCERLRVLTYNMRPIIIVLSKSSDVNDRIEFLKRGADDFISEPVNIDEFKMKIKAHLRRDIELSIDTKTLLPDKKHILRALKRLICDKTDKALLFISIENYFIYKSIYSEIASDKLIQSFVTITKSALTENDYLGRFSENEFLIITTPDVVEKLAGFLTFAFDIVAPKFYSKEDMDRGFSLVKGERFAERRVELVYILAGGGEIDYNNLKAPEEVLTHLRAVKSMSKLPNGSNYAIERLQLTGAGSVITREFNKKVYIYEEDEALKLLIRTSLELQGYDIARNITDEVPAVIIFDAGDELENLKKITEIKQDRNFVNSKFIVTASKHNKSAILKTKADLYMPKPYEIADLLYWVDIFMKEVNY